MSYERTRDSLGHIVVIAGDYPTKGHQRYVFVQQLVEAFIEMGIRITVVAPQSIVHALIHKEKLKSRRAIEHTKNGIEYVVYRPIIVTSGNSQRLKIIQDYCNNIILRRLLDRLQPNVLYTHFWSSALLVSQYARKKALPLYVACGEGDNAIEEMVSNLPPREMQELAKTVTGVISVSSENKRKCIENHLAKAERIVVFPNCVDTDLFKAIDKKECREILGLKDEDFIISFVGGFIPRKGPNRLAQAIAEIEDSSIKVMFIGKEFPGYPLDFSCPGIVFKGAVDHDDLPSYLGASDIFVLPTQKEGCCNAIVEALAMGLPVISSIGSFNDDILDDDNSIRIDPDDVEAIKNALLRLKVDDRLRERMREYSLAKHESYSVIGRAKGIIRFIRDTLPMKKKGDKYKTEFIIN